MRFLHVFWFDWEFPIKSGPARFANRPYLGFAIFEKGENADFKIGDTPPPPEGERNEPVFEYKNISGDPNSAIIFTILDKGKNGYLKIGNNPPSPREGVWHFLKKFVVSFFFTRRDRAYVR